MKYKCIIFDCDGVLVDSEAISIGLIVEFARELGLNMDLNEAISTFSGTNLKKCFDYISEKTGVDIPDDFQSRYRTESFRRFESDLLPVDGIENVLSSLNVPFCVASNGPEEKVIFNLKNTGLFDHFESNIYSAYTIGKWKPDPELFIQAAKGMGFLPSECAVVEDSVSGIKAGVAGGFDTYALSHGGNEEVLKTHGAEVFFHMDELLDLLSNR